MFQGQTRSLKRKAPGLIGDSGKSKTLFFCTIDSDRPNFVYSKLTDQQEMRTSFLFCVKYAVFLLKCDVPLQVAMLEMESQ